MTIEDFLYKTKGIVVFDNFDKIVHHVTYKEAIRWFELILSDSPVSMPNILIASVNVSSTFIIDYRGETYIVIEQKSFMQYLFTPFINDNTFLYSFYKPVNSLSKFPKDDKHPDMDIYPALCSTYYREDFLHKYEVFISFYIIAHELGHFLHNNDDISNFTIDDYIYWLEDKRGIVVSDNFIDSLKSNNSFNEVFSVSSCISESKADFYAIQRAIEFLTITEGCYSPVEIACFYLILSKTIRYYMYLELISGKNVNVNLKEYDLRELVVTKKIHSFFSDFINATDQYISSKAEFENYKLDIPSIEKNYYSLIKQLNSELNNYYDTKVQIVNDLYNETHELYSEITSIHYQMGEKLDIHYFSNRWDFFDNLYDVIPLQISSKSDLMNYTIFMNYLNNQ